MFNTELPYGRHDAGDLISLTRRAVNTRNPSMKDERVGV